MFDLKEYIKKVDRIRKEAGCITNNFLPLSALENISKQEDSQIFFNENALVLHCDNNAVHRVYFYISSLEKLTELERFINDFCEYPLVVECIGKEKDVESLSAMLEKIGFTAYAHMSRWRSNCIMHFCELDSQMERFITAGMEHLVGVQRLLAVSFDPLVSHLPDTNKLESLIDDNSVFCLMENGQVQALACVERAGEKGVYLYQFAVSEVCKGKGIGSAIFQYALGRYPSCNNYISWTADDNIASNRIHEKFGMKRDGLKSIVLVHKQKG